MKVISLFNIAQFTRICCVNKIGTLAVASIIELMHKNDSLLSRLEEDYASDVAYCAEHYKLPENVSREIISLFTLRGEQMREYVKLKAECEWDDNETEEITLNRLISVLNTMALYTHFSEYRLSAALSEWICEGKPGLKAYFPFNSMVEAEKYIGRRSEENCFLNVGATKSTIDYLLMALSDVSFKLEESRFESLYEAPADRYDVGFSVPPMGVKLENRDVLEALVIENMCASIKGRFACIVPAGLAFQNTGRISMLRKTLVESKRIAAIAELPSGFVAGTFIKTIILLFDGKGAEHEDILMIDLSDAKYKDEELSSRASFVLNEKAVSVFQDALRGNLGEKCEMASLEKIANDRYSLLPSKYAMSEETKLYLKRLAEFPCSKTLGEIATIYRAQATKSEEIGNEYFEVGASDINEYGFVKAPEKIIRLAPESKCLKNRINKNDIIFSIKGTVGKVALIERETDNWLVNQSFVIIRVTDGAYTPEFVFRQLKSKVGRQYIEFNATGNVIMSLAIDKLKNFAIQDPTEEGLKEAEEKTQRQIHLLCEVENIKKELSEIDE